MDKREKLAERAHVKYYGYEIPDDLERYVWLGVIDVILDELMEPGDRALFAGWPIKGGTPDEMRKIWQAILTHIKAGKP